jgi:hypothetical protein
LQALISGVSFSALRHDEILGLLHYYANRRVWYVDRSSGSTIAPYTTSIRFEPSGKRAADGCKIGKAAQFVQSATG